MTVSIEPVHPGEILYEDVLPALSTSKTAEAAALGLSRRTLYDILNGTGRSGWRGRSSGDASPLSVENENIIGGQRAQVPGPPVRVQKLHFQATTREQLDDSAYVTRLDLRIARAVEHGDHIQQLQFSFLGHINRRSSV